MGRDSATASDIVVPANKIQGNPRPRALAQWVSHEDRPWWTEEELARRRGLAPERTTARFLEHSVTGWRLHVLNDAERAELFRDRGPERV